MKFVFHDRYSRIIILVAVFMAPLVFGGARRALLSNKNDVKEWLPDSFAETQTYQWFRRHFEGEEFVLVSWDNCTINDQRLRLFEKKATVPAALEPATAPPAKHPGAFVGRVEATDPAVPLVDQRARFFTEVISAQA